MRWDNLRAVAESGPSEAAPLFDRDAVVRTFDTPEFRGMTFYEVRARSIVNRVPAASHMPFRWTINPYRGCSHACVYCFARKTHTYLGLDAGEDFDTKVVVKVNAPELLRAELASPRWRGEPIAMGTNVDPYQRAEGRYRLMRGILEALRDARNPFSILTKGALVLRDLALLTEAAADAEVGTSVSVGSIDRDLWREVEPGTPSPQRRLEVCRALADAGVGCGVLMAPILPFLSDSPRQLAATVRAIADAGATSIVPVVLHLRPGAREWYLAWLAERHPDLLPRYRRLYAKGASAPPSYRREIVGRVHELAERAGLGPGRPTGHPSTARRPRPRTPAPAPAGEQLALL